MRLKWYTPILLTALACVFSAGQARAQDTLVVQYQVAGGGNVIVNALRNAIANDTARPAGRVYKLLRGGLYYNEDTIENPGFHLRIVGETRAAAGQQDFGPAVIQMVTRADGTVNQRMLTGQDNLTLKNLWITGQDDKGSTTAYHPIQFEASGKRIVFDNMIFERSNFAIMGVPGANNRVFITNSKYRNFVNTSQFYEGRGIRLEAGADTLVMENNTFFNIGHTIVQSEALPINYLRFNHNTMVNVGRNINAGAIWKSAFFVNNVVVNGWWQGEGHSDITQPNREDPFSGWFGIAALPAAFGAEQSRRIVYANSSYWRDPAFAAYYADSIRAQPLFNAITKARFDANDNMNEMNNLVGVNPGLPSYTSGPEPLSGLVAKMIQNIRQLRAGTVPAANWLWDPGRVRTDFQGASFVYPLQENFAYTNAQLRTAGTDGLPLGDLNWFPASKATFQANRAQYVAQIEGLAVGKKIDVFTTIEGEATTLSGGATVEAFSGFSYFRFESGGFVNWDFTLPQSGAYALRVRTNIGSETQRGQFLRVNGTNLRNNSGFGEWYYCTTAQAGCPSPIAANTWTTVDVTPATVIEGATALNMNAGANTIRLSPSWGYQNFSGVDILNAGGVVVKELKAPDATSSLALPNCQDATYCPSGFKSAALGAGGSASFAFNAPASGKYLLRIFYQSPLGSAQGRVTVDGVTAANVSFAGEAGVETGRDVSTGEFTLAKGAHTIALADAAGLKVDYLQVLGVDITVGIEEDALPTGFALGRTFPNPARAGGTTRIEYALTQAQSMRLSVYDVLGRQVAVLVDGVQPSGAGVASFSNDALSAGTYFVRLETANGQQTRTMTVLR